MRRYVHHTLVAAFAITLSFVQGPANAFEFLNRIAEFAEDTLKETKVDPDGPPPFRVGLMLPRSGGQREDADRVIRGWEIALALTDRHVGERPVKLIIGDTSGAPGDTLETAKSMTTDGGIDIFAGVIGANTAALMARFTAQMKRPLALAGAIGESVMTDACFPHVVRTSFNIAPYQTTSGRFIAGKYKTMVTLGPDTKGGHRIVGRFVKAYRQAGGRIIEQAWATMGRKYDWEAMLSRSTLGGPQAVYTFFEGRNAQRIVRQFSRITAKQQVALIGPQWLFGARVMRRAGKHAAGLRFLTSHLPTLETPANRIFADAYRKAHGEDPDPYAYMGYENALAVLLTAAEFDGRIPDGERFVSTMKKVSFVGLMPRGEFALNQSNSAFLKRLFWVEVEHDDDGARLRKLAAIPIDADKSSCKKQTANRKP